MSFKQPVSQHQPPRREGEHHQIGGKENVAAKAFEQ
jgi:hypothetical protein